MHSKASLKRLRSLDLRRISPGHGPVNQVPPAKIAGDIEQRRLRERLMLKDLETGARTVPDMVARIYRDASAGLCALAEESI